VCVTQSIAFRKEKRRKKNMDDAIEMTPQRKAGVEAQQADLERHLSVTQDGKKRSRLQMGAILTALFVRLHQFHHIHNDRDPRFQFLLTFPHSSPSSSPPSTQQSFLPPRPPSPLT
jgi:hypothetical protein